MKRLVAGMFVVVCCFVVSRQSFAGGQSLGQTMYVPAAYVDLNYYDTEGNVIYREMFVSRLFFCNTDPNNEVVLNSVDFHDPDGNLVMGYLEEPEIIPPLGSVSYAASPGVLQIPLYDRDGGRPSFIVKWTTRNRFRAVNPPLIEVGRFIVRPVEGVPGANTVVALDVASGVPIEQKFPSSFAPFSFSEAR